ncbi:MAG: helix-turn-helix domain-containing protein [Sulfuricaulis sp.]
MPIKKLATLVAEKKLSQPDIARETGVDQGQVSRILAGHSKRLSRNTLKLCQYAETVKPDSVSTNTARDLQETILGIWNGTSQHAQALKQLLQTIDATQQSFRLRDK